MTRGTLGLLGLLVMVAGVGLLLRATMLQGSAGEAASTPWRVAGMVVVGIGLVCRLLAYRMRR